MRNEVRLQVRQAREALAALHPGLFDLTHPKPFAIGISAQLTALYPEMPKRTISGLLGWLTCRRAYLLACKPGAPRYALSGDPAGVVSDAEAQYAACRFIERDARAVDKWAGRVAA